MSGSLNTSNNDRSNDHCALCEFIIRTNAVSCCDIYSRADFINISALKGGVYSRTDFINISALKCGIYSMGGVKSNKYRIRTHNNRLRYR